MSKIGTVVKNLRRQSGLSQGQIAGFLGVDQGTVSKYESGERKITVESLMKLGDLFGVDYLQLAEGDGEKMPSLRFAFRANEIQQDDLQVIAEMNRIAMNIREMEELLGR